MPGAKKGLPFRKWYGCLGELRSLIPEDKKLMILTATATGETKSEILKTLHLDDKEIKIIEQNPIRPNLKYYIHYLDNSVSFSTAFSSLINELKAEGKQTPRTLIYCQTRKQCSVLFRVFEV